MVCISNENQKMNSELEDVYRYNLVIEEQLKVSNFEIEKLGSELTEIKSSEAHSEGDNEDSTNLYTPFLANEVQPLEDKVMVLERTSLYLYPNKGADVIESNVQGNVIVLYETSIEEEKWVYIEFIDHIYDSLIYGFVESKFLSESNENLIIDEVKVSENISIGMTFDELKLLYGRNYISLKDFYGDHVIFYFDEERYVNEVERFNTGDSYRASYEDALICNFSKEYNQLYSIQVTSPFIELSSGLSIGDSYNQVEIYYNQNYPKYTDDNYVDQMPTYKLSDNVIITFFCDETKEKLTRFDIKYIN
jgi:hypothetical protein